MSNQTSSTSSPLKVFLGAMGVFVFFGFLALILSGYAGHESIEDRAYLGEFDAETIQQRWENLEAVETAQAELLDEAKVTAAMAALVKNAPKAAKTTIVVPGSPTFLKQMEEASAPAVAPDAPAAAEEKKSEPAADKPAPEAKPAPADKPAPEAKPAPAGDTVKAETEAPAAKSEPKAEAEPKAKPAPADDQPAQ